MTKFIQSHIATVLIKFFSKLKFWFTQPKEEDPRNSSITSKLIWNMI